MEKQRVEETEKRIEEEKEEIKEKGAEEGNKKGEIEEEADEDEVAKGEGKKDAEEETKEIKKKKKCTKTKKIKREMRGLRQNFLERSKGEDLRREALVRSGRFGKNEDVGARGGGTRSGDGEVEQAGGEMGQKRLESRSGQEANNRAGFNPNTHRPNNFVNQKRDNGGVGLGTQNGSNSFQQGPTNDGSNNKGNGPNSFITRPNDLLHLQGLVMKDPGEQQGLTQGETMSNANKRRGARFRRLLSKERAE